MYHTFIRGSNLYDTLQMNLLAKNILEMSYGSLGKGWWGKPIWEFQPTLSTDKEKVTNATRTFLGRLVPLKRLLLVNNDCSSILMGDGLEYPTFNDSKNSFLPEPSATIKRVINKKKNKEDYILLGHRAGVATWRELPALIAKRSTNQIGGALCLANILPEKQFDLVICSLARNKATILDTMESVYHVPRNMVSSMGITAYENEVKIAELISKKLGWAMEEYRKNFDGGWEGRLKSASSSYTLREQLHSRATTHYWTTIEKSLPLLMAHVEAIGTFAERVETTRKLWHKALYLAARESYELVCSRETPRQIRAFALGWEVLNKKEQDIEKIQENSNKEEESL
jgi:CRISPR system Cascade subunit CasA